MYISSSSYGGHSAKVEIQLVLNGSTISVNQLGPGFLLLDVAHDHPPCEGTLILRIDQSERRWNVRLPDGISADAMRVTIANV